MSSPTTRVSIDTRQQIMATLRRLRPLCIHFYNNRRSRAVPSSVQYRAVPDEMDFYRHDLSSSRCASLSSSITIRFFLSYPTQSICRLLLRKHSRDWPCGDCRSDCGKISSATAAVRPGSSPASLQRDLSGIRRELLCYGNKAALRYHVPYLACR